MDLLEAERLEIFRSVTNMDDGFVQGSDATPKLYTACPSYGANVGSSSSRLQTRQIDWD